MDGTVIVSQRGETHPLHLLEQQRDVVDALRDDVLYVMHAQSLTQSGMYLQIWANGKQKLAKNTSGKHKKRSTDFLPPYASQSQLAAMISCRTFTACDLNNEEWRPLVGMLCFGNQATIWVKSHTV